MKEKVRIEVSARHVHLTRQDLETLFGEGYQLTKLEDLSQPGQFVAEEQVSLIGEKRQIDSVRVVGPCRNYTQIEISKSDSFFLGCKAPLRLSGKILKSGPIKIKGPVGELDLKEGVIVAKRHIHLTDFQSKNLGVENGQNLKLEIEGERGLVFDKVEVRVSEEADSAVHLDTDEGNAAGLAREGEGFLIIE